MSENGDAKVAPSELEKKIIKQIEFYFGDMNLARDKFLQAEIKADDGWVPLSTMIKFNRLKQLTEDCTVITVALKKSTTGLMQINEDEKKIRRNPDKPLPEITKDRLVDSRKRTIYAKGFPLDSTLDELMQYFEQCGEVELVKMRKDAEKKFKGSVFTTYCSQDDAQKFLGDKRTYGEGESSKELITYLNDDYYKMKNEEKKNQGKEKKEHQNEEKEKREAAYEADQEKRFLAGITKCAILEITCLKDTTQREDIAAVFNQYSTIAWQDFKKGDTKAMIRFEDEDGAKNAWDKAVSSAADGKVCILEQQVEGRVLEGDDEIAHWRFIRKDQEQKKSRHGKYQKSGRGGGRGGRGRGRGRHGPSRRHDRNDEREAQGDGDAPPAKVRKIEESTIKAEVKTEVKTGGD